MNERKLKTEKMTSCHARLPPIAATMAAAMAPMEKQATANPAVKISKMKKNRATITQMTQADSDIMNRKEASPPALPQREEAPYVETIRTMSLTFY